MSEPVDRAVETAFPERVVESIEPRTTRPGNETAFVTFADADPVYVKTATDTTRRLVRETAATRYAAANCAVRVPEVRAADPTGDRPYLVTDPLPGTPLNDPWTAGADREPLLRTAGRALAGVHEARIARPGVVVGGDDERLDLDGESWAETLCATVEWRAEDWFADRFADVPERLVETVRAVDPGLDEVEPTLLHADCSRINVHVDPAGLLDWERALVGDPAFDLVDATFHLAGQPDVDETDRDRLTAALYDGYRERAGTLPPGLDGYEPLYRAVSFLLVPQTFEEWAPDAEESTDDLAAWVREEVDGRLDAARDVTA
jgi:aminoglycoside phosphotransferase (APT) family kinase protein